MDIVSIYIEKRTAELENMLELYYLADKSYPIELLSRVDELARLKSKLEESTKMSKRLTAKQETFVAEVVKNGGNATAAAQVAYPNATYGTCKTIGWQNMTKYDLAKAIREEFSKQGVTLEKRRKTYRKGPRS